MTTKLMLSKYLMNLGANKSEWVLKVEITGKV
jgi:hypothetical protein